MTTALEELSLTDRLLLAFPSGTYCLPALLSLAKIVETTEIPTAAVQCKARPKLLINPEWTAKHAKTPEKLVMLTLHELHHVILGHTRLYPRVTLIDNLVFDAVINSMLCHLFPDTPYTSLFCDFYDESKFPECLLRPPSNWVPNTTVAVPSALAGHRCRSLAALYRKLYSPIGASYDELRDALTAHDGMIQFDSGKLLGDHGEESEGASSSGDLETRAPELLAQVRRMVEQWPLPPNPIIGRSVHAFLHSRTVAIRPKTNRESLVSIFRKIADISHHGNSIRKLAAEETWVEGPIPRIDRRSAVMTSLGHRPMLFRHTIETRRIRRTGCRVHVYVDVSGSVQSLTGALYGAILSCREFVHPVVHLFSTQVVDATIRQLTEGFCKSTGGTCIECVTDHMNKNNIRRAVLVTDGYVGAPSLGSSAILKRSQIGVALTPGNINRRDLAEFVKIWSQLKEVSS